MAEIKRALRKADEWVTNALIGTGYGITNQLEGLYQMAAHPVQTVQGLAQIASQPREIPGMVANALVDTAKRATSGPLGFGEVMGENLSPSMFRRNPLVRQDAVKPDYGMAHRPPGRHYGAPGHDVTNLIPDDVYGPNAVRYYGHMGPSIDGESLRIMRQIRGNPDAEVTIYRAIPKDAPADAKISPGDWVTINKRYARTHGDSVLDGNYRIVETRVKAKDIFTSGDSINEWGYDPE